MKILTVIFAAVVITTKASAKDNTAFSQGTIQENFIKTACSIEHNSIYSGKDSHRKIRRTMKLLSKNPFRIVSLQCGCRY
jgi:hypothetical protein